jgi:hypothetical protein
MKNFFRKINRGVALAIILIVGLTVFFIVDAAAFEKEKPELKNFLEEFLEECAKINLLPEQYRVPGADIPEDVIEAKTKETKDFVDKYFTEYNSRQHQYSVSTKQQIQWLTENMHQENQRNKNVIENLSYTLVDISGIQKQATNAVRISFTVSMNLSASPDVRFLNITQPVWGWGYMIYSNNTDEIQSMGSEFSMNITLFKVNGEWKIADALQGGAFYGGRGVVRIG